jgi:hypothetical protein
MWVSRPCKAIVANRGDQGPPGLVPAAVRNHVPWSTAPAWSQVLSWRLRPGLALTLVSQAVGLIRSQHVSIAASRTYVAVWPMAVCSAVIAS